MGKEYGVRPSDFRRGTLEDLEFDLSIYLFVGGEEMHKHAFEERVRKLKEQSQAS